MATTNSKNLADVHNRVQNLPLIRFKITVEPLDHASQLCTRNEANMFFPPYPSQPDLDPRIFIMTARVNRFADLMNATKPYPQNQRNADGMLVN